MNKILITTVALITFLSCEKNKCEHCQLIERDNIAPICGYAYNGDGWEEDVAFDYGMICSEEEREQLRDEHQGVYTFLHPCGKEYTLELIVRCE